MLRDLCKGSPSLYNPVAIETLRAAAAALPAVPHVAAFDTAFPATLPERAYRYALPATWVEAHGIRRYGFHGLSVSWASGGRRSSCGPTTGSRSSSPTSAVAAPSPPSIAGDRSRRRWG